MEHETEHTPEATTAARIISQGNPAHTSWMATIIDRETRLIQLKEQRDALLTSHEEILRFMDNETTAFPFRVEMAKEIATAAISKAKKGTEQ